MSSATRYDDVLPRFASLVEKELGPKSLFENLFLRDATGRVTFMVLSPIPDPVLATLRSNAAELAPYVEPDGAVATPEDFFDGSLRDPAAGLPEWLDHPAYRGFVRLVERRIVGQDWLQPPRDPMEGVPPIMVFASHKGGVGRSTALGVSAAPPSAEGFNVLVIDLDMEAPGLGEILLNKAPKFGSLDYFVEDGLSELDEGFFEDLMIPSQLSTSGLVHVGPAIGEVGNANPQNVLGKLARAYLEKALDDATVESFLDRTRKLVRRLAERTRYDAIFIDASYG